MDFILPRPCVCACRNAKDLHFFFLRRERLTSSLFLDTSNVEFETSLDWFRYRKEDSEFCLRLSKFKNFDFFQTFEELEQEWKNTFQLTMRTKRVKESGLLRAVWHKFVNIDISDNIHHHHEESDDPASQQLSPATNIVVANIVAVENIEVAKEANIPLVTYDSDEALGVPFECISDAEPDIQLIHPVDHIRIGEVMYTNLNDSRIFLDNRECILHLYDSTVDRYLRYKLRKDDKRIITSSDRANRWPVTKHLFTDGLYLDEILSRITIIYALSHLHNTIVKTIGIPPVKFINGVLANYPVYYLTDDNSKYNEYFTVSVNHCNHLADIEVGLSVDLRSIVLDRIRISKTSKYVHKGELQTILSRYL